MSSTPKTPSLKKRMVLMLVIVALLMGGLVGFQLFRVMMMHKYLSGAGAPPQTVSTTIARKTPWHARFDVVGSLRAFRGVDISPEISGTVRKVYFHSGQQVRAGDVLVEMVDDLERAQVKVLEASVQLARTTLERDQPQLAVQAISKAQWDADEADLKSKEAQLAQQQAVLAKKTLTAPFDGRLGIISLSPGQFVNPGDKITTLQQLSPMMVDFNIAQTQIADLHVGDPVEVEPDGLPGTRFGGNVTAFSSQEDPSTRNLAVEARVDNSSQKLLPGMYGKIHWTYGKEQALITLPQSALTYNPYGTTVFVVKRVEPKMSPQTGKPMGTGLEARQVFVTVGESRGDQAAVLSGVDEGDTVVTSGQMKLANGTPVIVNNALQPRDEAHPTPQER